MESAGVHKTSDKEEVVRDKAGVKMKSEQASHQSSRGKEDKEDKEEDEGKLETCDMEVGKHWDCGGPCHSWNPHRYPYLGHTPFLVQDRLHLT